MNYPSTNPYVFPSDGYLSLSADASAYISYAIIDPDGAGLASITAIGALNTADNMSIFVKKGMKAYYFNYSGSVGASFIELTN